MTEIRGEFQAKQYLKFYLYSVSYFLWVGREVCVCVGWGWVVKFGRHRISFCLTYHHQVHVFLTATEYIAGRTGKHPAIQVLGVSNLQPLRGLHVPPVLCGIHSWAPRLVSLGRPGCSTGEGNVTAVLYRQDVVGRALYCWSGWKNVLINMAYFL